MANQPDVVIVGGGAVGVCTAYSLLERGFSVTLIEKGLIGEGSSYGNAGLIVPSHSVPLAAPGVWRQGLKWLLNPASPLYIKPRPDPALLRWLLLFLRACDPKRLPPAIDTLANLSHASRALFEQLVARENLRFGYRHRGGLALYLSAKSLEKGAEEAHLLGEHGVETRVLDAAAVYALEPSASAEICGGVYFPQDADLSPHDFVQQVARAVEARGGVILTNTEVTGFQTEGGRITAVETSAGRLMPREVVLASGAWSPAVARDLRLRLPIQAAKGYSVTIDSPPNAPAIPLHLSEIKVVVTPMGDKLRFAGTLELAGFDRSIDARRLQAMKDGIAGYLDTRTDFAAAKTWCGLRPLTPDTLPIVGRTGRCANLIIASGHGMLGISLAPITGQLVAEIASNSPTSHDISLLTPDRF